MDGALRFEFCQEKNLLELVEVPGTRTSCPSRSVCYDATRFKLFEITTEWGFRQLLGALSGVTCPRKEAEFGRDQAGVRVSCAVFFPSGGS